MNRASKFRTGVSLALVVFAGSAGLGGCMTKRIKPAPSAAIMEARAHRDRPPPPACPHKALAEISPVFVGFPFGETALDEPGGRIVDTAAAWLVCNPGVEVVIRPDADVHGAAAVQNALADARARAVHERLRSAGATSSVVRILPRGAPAPGADVLYIRAEGRRW